MIVEAFVKGYKGIVDNNDMDDCARLLRKNPRFSKMVAQKLLSNAPEG
jgi:hypothetical protein